MGEYEGWAEPGRPLPNGLLQGAGPVMRAIDTDRWSKAEERTAELIDCIQPNKLSEERRNAVAHYVQRLIMNCFPCQVCTFGSVPLKTYLPDGDIDLTAFSHDQNVKDIWANQVRDMLENEEKNENAEFHVKEVQYIQAEVKIIKCLVANIVVDISFNQVGGLCTLCFLDEVDNLINQNHLFKRSIILIKAWCYYESRILGAHHGLISTYALETLVLYIFHVFNNSFHGPLEVLYRFLEFFSNFDWDNFCVSLWGPVPISSLPDVTAEPPRKDSGELLLSKLFLDACSSVYAVLPGGKENNGQPFVSKHFNVIDPLRVNNNLGRSVSKGNFFRIRSAFAFGAKRLARLLDCPKDNLTFEVNQFFMNTWERHGSGHRPDAPRSSTPDIHHENPNNHRSGKKMNGNFPVHKMEDEKIRGRGIFSQHGKSSHRMVPTTSELSSASYMQRLKNQLNSNSSQVSDKIGKDTTSDQVVLNDEVERDVNRDHLVNENQGRFRFARTRSSPELIATYGDVSSQVWRKRQTETKNPHETCSLVDNMHAPSKKCVDSAESNSVSNSYQWDLGLDSINEEFPSSASLQDFDGQVHIPFNLNSTHLPFPIPPSFLASMRHSQRNLPGFFPTNIPLINPSLSDVQFPHGLVSPQLNHYFPGIGLNSPSEDSFDQNNENICSVEVNSREDDNGLWQDQDVCSSGSYDPSDENLDLQFDGKKPTVAKYVPPFRARGSAKNVQHKHTREKRGPTCQNNESFSSQDVRSSDVNTEERTISRFSSAARSSSLRSRTSSESSWNGSSAKNPKPTKQRWGKKTVSTDLATSHGKGKTMTNQTDHDDQECGVLSNMGNEMVKRNEIAQTSGSDSMIPFAPMLIRPGSRERMNDNSGLIAFYPTGPPIPFVTMLPLRNMPPETGTSDEISGNSESGRNFDHSNDFILRGTDAAEASEEKIPDILYSDFDSHWQNLQFGRFCQNPQPSMHPSPLVVPPAYFQGQFPYDTPGRPLSNNPNLFPQLMTCYGHHMVPVGPVQSVPNRPPNMYQHYIDDTPKYRSGTGTYLPNPKVSVRERHSFDNRRGNYNNHDRNNNYGYREGNWNSPKSRGALRNHSRNQTDKSNSRADRLTPSDSPSDHSWNSSSRRNGSQNVAYSMYPLAATHPDGVTNGPSVPPVRFYPFDHDTAATYDSHGEQLEFGSRGEVNLGTNDQSQLNGRTRVRAFEDRRFHGNPGHQSSPDLPSSPRQQRRA